MTVHPAFGRRSLVALALAKAEAWLLEPVDEAERREALEARPRPVVAMVGLSAGCGSTTVARALAAELAVRDPISAAVVAGSDTPRGLSLGTPSAGHLARALAALGGERPRVAGRLCLATCGEHVALSAATRHLAPLVMEIPRGSSAGGVASLADHVVIVASAEMEPALAEVVGASLARVGPDPLIVANRVRDPDRWDGRAALRLPESAAGARLALAGREPRGELGAAISDLADICERA